MKHPVSLVAFLLVASVTTGCGAAPAGKAEFTAACLDRMGASQAECACYAQSIEQELTPEQFAAVAKGAKENRGSRDMLPGSLMTQPGIGSALLNATNTCLA